MSNGQKKKRRGGRDTWKAFERLVSGYFGTQRTPLSGGNSRHSRSDSLHPSLFIECKYGKRVAPSKLFRETAVMASEEEKIPVLCLKEKGSKGFLIVCHSDHLLNVADERENTLWRVV